MDFLKNTCCRTLFLHVKGKIMVGYLSAVCSRNRVATSYCIFLHHGDGMAPTVAYC